MSPYHFVFSGSAVKSRIIRSGAGGAVLSAFVVRLVRRRWRPMCGGCASAVSRVCG